MVSLDACAWRWVLVSALWAIDRIAAFTTGSSGRSTPVCTGSAGTDVIVANAREFERLIIDQLRQHILTESNIRELVKLVKLVDEEMDARAHEQRREQPELAAAEARKALAARRQLLDSAEVIAGFAEDMSEFPLISDITETKAFIRTFVKRITVRSGRAVIRYTIPMPQDSPIGRSDAAEVTLNGGVMSSVHVGGPSETVLRTFCWPIAL